MLYLRPTDGAAERANDLITLGPVPVCRERQRRESGTGFQLPTSSVAGEAESNGLKVTAVDVIVSQAVDSGK